MNNTSLKKRMIVFTLITLLLIACGGAAVEPTVTPTILPSPTPLSPVALLEVAVAAMEELESYHFEMIINMSVVSEGTSIETPVIFAGDFKAPDRFQGELNLELGELSIETEVIMIGESIYIKVPASGEWQMSTEPVTPFTPEDFVGLEEGDIANMEGLTLLRETVLGDVPVYHIEGMLSADAMEAVLGEAGGTNKVVYWIGVEDGWIRQLNVDFEFIEEADETTEISASLIITFSEFNKEISIEAP